MTASRRVAAIDCGTNSVRLLIGQARPGGGFDEIDRRLHLTRLGQGVDATGEFHPDALARTMAALDDYARDLETQVEAKNAALQARVAE